MAKPLRLVPTIRPAKSQHEGFVAADDRHHPQVVKHHHVDRVKHDWHDRLLARTPRRVEQMPQHFVEQIQANALRHDQGELERKLQPARAEYKKDRGLSPGIFGVSRGIDPRDSGSAPCHTCMLTIAMVRRSTSPPLTPKGRGNRRRAAKNPGKLSSQVARPFNQLKCVTELAHRYIARLTPRCPPHWALLGSALIRSARLALHCSALLCLNGAPERR